ncbi:hypothetical protein ZWY2020_027097 [Hordeum vulgare]|nr:hypothetical protein ZWY2020_027097 [Hordeum vulgare]
MRGTTTPVVQCKAQPVASRTCTESNRRELGPLPSPTPHRNRVSPAPPPPRSSGGDGLEQFLGHTYFRVEASYDGLLVISSRNDQFGVCNPATREYVPLWGFSGFTLMGMYPHAPTGEYRVIYQHLDAAAASQNGCYIVALGAGQPPRHVGNWAGRVKLMSQRALLFRGCLHWYRQQLGNQMNIIVVFDTIDESFRLMRAPVVPGRADLFEMDGMLGMSSFNDAATIIHIWVLRDYESKAWTFKCRIELPVKEIRARCENHDDRCHVVVLPRDGKLLVLVKFSEWLVQEKPAVRIAMEVYIVETGSGSRRFTAEVGRSTTVRELKDLIREKFGIESSSWLRLFIRSKELQNRNTMDYYDIVEGTTVKFEDVS